MLDDRCVLALANSVCLLALSRSDRHVLAWRLCAAGLRCAVLCLRYCNTAAEARQHARISYKKQGTHEDKTNKKGKSKTALFKGAALAISRSCHNFFFGKICIFRSSHTVSIITKQQDTRLTADVIPPEPNLLSLRSLSSTKSLRSPECFRFNYFWSASPNSTPCLCLHPVKLGLYFRHPAPRNSCNYVVSLVLLRRVKGWHRSECEWLALSPLSPM